jgi:hypothetical protein
MSNQTKAQLQHLLVEARADLENLLATSERYHKHLGGSENWQTVIDLRWSQDGARIMIAKIKDALR